MDGTEAIEPISTAITVRGETLQLSPLTIRQIPKFARAIQPGFAKLAIAADALLDGSPLGPQEWVDLLADHGDSLIDAAAVATGKPIEWLDTLDPADFLALVTGIVQVNADFFAQRLAPTLTAAARNGAGATPSNP